MRPDERRPRRLVSEMSTTQKGPVSNFFLRAEWERAARAADAEQGARWATDKLIHDGDSALRIAAAHVLQERRLPRQDWYITLDLHGEPVDFVAPAF